jgi:hypothetical protein
MTEEKLKDAMRRLGQAALTDDGPSLKEALAVDMEIASDPEGNVQYLTVLVGETATACGWLTGRRRVEEMARSQWGRRGMSDAEFAALKTVCLLARRELKMVEDELEEAEALRAKGEKA